MSGGGKVDTPKKPAPSPSPAIGVMQDNAAKSVKKKRTGREATILAERMMKPKEYQGLSSILGENYGS